MTNLLKPKKNWNKFSISDLGSLNGSSVDKKIVEGEKQVQLLNYMDVYKDVRISNKFNGFMKVSATDNQIEKFSLQRGDVLFTPSSETSEDIGHSSLYDSDAKALFSYHLARLHFEVEIDNGFKSYMFQASYIRKQFSMRAVGPIRFVLSANQIGKCFVYLPKTVLEQKRIADVLSKADEEIQLNKDKLAKMKEQQKSLMQLLLTGIVRVG